MDEIVSQALADITEDEWRAEARKWDWWSEEPYRLGNDSAVLAQALALHELAELQALCHECHVEAEADRRRAA
jgi:hypothetical protein